MIRTLSEDNIDYKNLEKYIEEELIGNDYSSQVYREDQLAQPLNSDEGFANICCKMDNIPDDLIKEVIDNIASVVILPTIYDNRLSYSIASRLMDKVRMVAKIFKFDHENYGGFCCVPTGKVSALAVPVKCSDGKSKVFIIFESGIFRFIHGVISLFVGSYPPNLLAGNDESEWRLEWHSFLHDDQRKADLLQSKADLSEWKSFFSDYNVRSQLAYSSIVDFGPVGQKIIHDMVFGCEIFVAAHEYAHAMLNHQRGDLNPAEIEKEADMWGVRIASIICKGEGVMLSFMVAGIAVFFSAIETSNPSFYLPAKERVCFVIKSLEIAPEEEKMHLDIANLMQDIFADIVNME